jgi:hypothetical protein
MDIDARMDAQAAKALAEKALRLARIAILVAVTGVVISILK